MRSLIPRRSHRPTSQTASSMTNWRCLVLLFLLAGTSECGGEGLELQARGHLHIPAPIFTPEDLLYVATINGELHCLSRSTGDQLWSLKEKPVINIPFASEAEAQLIPSAVDGALFGFVGPAKELKQLPLTIPQLVALSPSKSHDGLLYAGQKEDTWLAVNTQTGQRVARLGGDERRQEVSSEGGVVFLGKSEYTLSLYSAHDKLKKWQVSYSEYSSKKEPGNASLDFLSSATDGLLITSDRITGRVMWRRELASPAVGVFSWRDGLVKQPHTIFSPLAIRRLTEEVSDTLNRDHFKDKAMVSLYMAPVARGLFAMPALVVADNFHTGVIPVQTDIQDGQPEPGYFTFPGMQADNTWMPMPSSSPFPQLQGPTALAPKEAPFTWSTLASSLITTLLVTLLLYKLCITRPHAYQRGDIVYVGAISYDQTAVLGRGCDGTVVFKGRFDSRPVAVKRLVPECLELAAREVDLLRLSDQHPHVVRYFTTEAANHFKYIALELCDLTLADYVETSPQLSATGVELAHQALQGLAHLHSLGVVHRDVKPHNVLISTSGLQPRALISDFGLCKKLQPEKTSLSKRSGFSGTDGWSAPEALLSEGSLTTKIDMFGAGLLLYYVCSGGRHPFGEPLRRQSNIVLNHFDLFELTMTEQSTALHLISQLISVDPARRPSCSKVLIHPMFWTPARQLNFLLDVSDRLEKVGPDDEALQRLESDRYHVIRHNWLKHCGDLLFASLRSHRSYKGESVRDLLRAIRNKRNHYQELTDELKNVLGAVPTEYCQYFTARFPHLLIHTYQAVRILDHEHIFEQYYCDDAAI